MGERVIAGNSQIAKNTILLYLRQIFLIVISLYSSRVILATLGIEDYGIYNVVGGIALMFSFITTTMASASQRFLSYDIAQGDEERLSQTFSLTMLSYIFISVVSIVLCELVAVWFLNTYMNIPEKSLYEANWVLQFSIFSFIVNLVSTPYLSVIIAREKMGVYAYVSICDGLLKLGILFILRLWHSDRLILYALFMFIETVLVSIFYAIYTTRKFHESKYRYFYEKARLKEMFSFAWWNVLGSLSNVLRSQGINILLNIFFTPVVNAARGIAYNVNSAISNFSNNFYTAVRPQIIKRYAAGAIEEMLGLVYVSSKFAFFLLLILSLPILFETDYLLKIWLSTPPEYTSIFVKLIVVNSLMEVLNYPLVNAIQATGHIKTYQLIISGFYLLNLPISYILLKQGLPPQSTMYVNIALLFVCFWPRLIICRKTIGLSITNYFKVVINKICLVTSVSLILAYLSGYIINDYYTIIGFLLKSGLIISFTITSILIMGFNNLERKKLYSLIMLKVKK